MSEQTPEIKTLEPQIESISTEAPSASPKKKKASASPKKKKAPAKTTKDKLAEKKALRISSPFRKVILSRETLQFTIPSHVRDQAMEAAGIEELADLLDYMGKVVFNAKSKKIEIELVETKIAMGL